MRYLSINFRINRRALLAMAILILLLIVSYIFYYTIYGLAPASTIDNIISIHNPTALDRIIVFAPHQDDEVLGAGGYITKATSVGATVYIVFATDGNHLGLKNTRASEALKVADILGVPSSQLIFYNLPDGQLTNKQDELRQKLLSTIDEVKPNIIFVTDTGDIHLDHGTLGQSVIAVNNQTSTKAGIFTYLIHYPKYPRPQVLNPNLDLSPPTKFDTGSGIWQKFELSSAEVAQKRQAISHYQSQLHIPFLRSLMLSFIRRNELFLKASQ